MSKRTYGTGFLRQLPSGKWQFEYKPKWAPKRLFKTVEADSKKAAQKLLSDWVTELDRQDGPSVEVSIQDLMELHVANMRIEGRDPLNIDHVRKRATKHLGTYFAKRDFALPLKKAELTKYKQTRIEQGAARATINRELSALRRALVIAQKEGLISAVIPDFEKFDENNIRTGIVDDNKYCAILRRLPDPSADALVFRLPHRCP
jgi:hypothetical protein